MPEAELFRIVRPDSQIEFEQFWNGYPRKVARASAIKMWLRLTDEEKRLAVDALPRHVKLWQGEHRESSRIPHAATWLNPVDGRRWEDEIEESLPQHSAGTEAAREWMKGRLKR